MLTSLLGNPNKKLLNVDENQSKYGGTGVL